jgi:hypothetical protein
MDDLKSPPALSLVSSNATSETMLQRIRREERELLEDRGVGIGPVSAEFLEGMRLCVEMLQKGESSEGEDASLDRQFRDCAQINFALPFLRRLKLFNSREIEAGFAAVLSDVIHNGLQYNGSDHVADLVEGAEVARA